MKPPNIIAEQGRAIPIIEIVDHVAKSANFLATDSMKDVVARGMAAEGANAIVCTEGAFGRACSCRLPDILPCHRPNLRMCVLANVFKETNDADI